MINKMISKKRLQLLLENFSPRVKQIGGDLVKLVEVAEYNRLGICWQTVRTSQSKPFFQRQICNHNQGHAKSKGERKRTK